MAAVTILNFENRKILLVNRVNSAETHHSAKFRKNWPVHYKDIAIFRFFFQMAAVRHDGFVWSRLGQPTKSIY